MDLLLGVDGGATKTIAVLADQNGQVVGTGTGGAANFQVADWEQCRAEVDRSIRGALQRAGASEKAVKAAYFGMAGADRPRDYELVRELLLPVVPVGAEWSFDNDALLGLWAATTSGVGVGVVCGTGTNVVGINYQGKKVQIGGMGTIFGDYAGGSYLGELAVARAMRGIEGRGKKTILYDLLCDHYGVDELLDLVDWIYAGKSLRLSALVPLVVDAALEEDQVAREILIDVGQEMGVSANAAIRALFTPGELVQVVAIGSVFRKSKSPLMYKRFVQTLEQTDYHVLPTILQAEPVLGAVFGAFAQLKLEVTERIKSRAQSSLAEALSFQT